MGFLAAQLCGGLYGKSGSMDLSRGSASDYVFLDYEETESAYEKERVKKERTEGRCLLFSLFF